MAERPGALLVVAEDDDDDFTLLEKALREGGFEGPLARASDGSELLSLLRAKRKEGVKFIVLLDLNMPVLGGREALREIRSDPHLKTVPVAVFSSSASPSDIARVYDDGANSVLQKPMGFSNLVETFRAFREYWLETVELP